MSEKLLTIGIPTYNRPDCIAKLSQDFISPMLDQMGHQVAVLVCDNSTGPVAEANRKALDIRVEYHMNGENVGFAGNVRNCLHRTKTRYVWLISDDDPVILENFITIFRQLEENPNIGCLMVPYVSYGHLGDEVVCNTKATWGAGDLTLGSLIQSGQLPFIFLSSAILRMRQDRIEKYATEVVGNAYAHSIYYIGMLDRESRIEFAGQPVVVYTCDHTRGCISILAMRRSLIEVRKLLAREFALARDVELRDYQGWLLWMIHYRGGLYNLKDAAEERLELVAECRNYLSPKTVALAAAALMPAWLLRPIYLIYRTRMDRSPRRNAMATLKLNFAFTQKVIKARA